MTSVTVSSLIIPSSPADQKIIFEAIKEIDNSMTRIAGERAQIKAILDNVSDQFEDIDKKFIKKMAQVYHKQNFSQVQGENEDFVELYSKICE